MGHLPQQWAYTLLIIGNVCSSSDDNVELGSGIDIDLALTINVANIQFVEEVDNELPSFKTEQGDKAENCNTRDGRSLGPEASRLENSGAVLGWSAMLWTTLYSVFLILQWSLT
ncbi:hypothetical protein ACJMK2_006626 [Sinanodonta woodiana]|uniref:Uncharacterized protein n=1 Tax=Sinanodonta woodiana TaxID=1069815 RepID=A0ABD3VTT6_SINWO